MTEMSLIARKDFDQAKADIMAAINENNEKIRNATSKPERKARALAQLRLWTQYDRVDEAEDAWRASRLGVTDAERRLATLTDSARGFAADVSDLQRLLDRITRVTGNLTCLITALA